MLVDKIDNHVPLPSVTGGVLKEEGQQSASLPLAGVPLGDLDHSVEEIIAPFDLVPEEKVTLAELEVVQVVLLHERDPHGIQGSEEPTAPGTLLVGHRFHLVNLEKEKTKTFKNYFLAGSELAETCPVV